jgi:hypothetical protein
MTHITGHDRCQMLLLPEAVDATSLPTTRRGSSTPLSMGSMLLRQGSPASFRKRLATQTMPRRPPEVLYLRLSEPGAVEPAARGGDPSQPRVIWLLRHLKPDFKTIADFRRDNRAAFRSVFREFVLLCRPLDLFGRELLAVGGTPDQGGQQQGPQFHASIADQVHPRRRRTACPPAGQRRSKPVAVRARKTSPRRLRGCELRAIGTGRCWRSSNGPARARSR